MYRITFQTVDGGSIFVFAEFGENILTLSHRAGIGIDAPCGGNGTCGKCRVQLVMGHIESEKTPHISDEEYADGWRLACLSSVSAEAVIKVPAAAASYKSDIKTADLSTPEELRRYRAAIDKIFAAGIARGCAQQGCGVAVDIGTTTVTAAFFDLQSGELRARASAGNGQIRYGADVINRIIASARPGGREALRAAVLDETILPLVAELCAGAGVTPDAVTRCVVAGNTTMEHLFLGVNAESIRLEPYEPTFLEKTGVTAAATGLPFPANVPVILAPNVGSYVGGDITAGTLTSMLWNMDGLHLFIDLGTNGELVLGNRDFLLCCACSAGPAFEGGDISCGMRATTGAIESVKIDRDTLEPILGVVGGGTPVGLCGSGLIDLIAELFRCGVIDAKGKFIRSGERITRDEYGAAYVLAFRRDAGGGRDVAVNETDIDSFIRAKAAIFSAIRAMLGSLDLTVDMLDSVKIAGGIGSGIGIQNAISIGMLPAVPVEKYEYAGNTSLTGACAMLLSDEATEKVFELGHSMTYLELSTQPGYMNEFIAACFLPHTDAGLFEVMG